MHLTVASQAAIQALPESSQIVDETRCDGVNELRFRAAHGRATPLAEPHVKVNAALATVGTVVVTDILTDARTAV